MRCETNKRKKLKSPCSCLPAGTFKVKWYKCTCVEFFVMLGSCVHHWYWSALKTIVTNLFGNICEYFDLIAWNKINAVPERKWWILSPLSECKKRIYCIKIRESLTHDLSGVELILEIVKGFPRSLNTSSDVEHGGSSLHSKWFVDKGREELFYFMLF